MSLFRKSLSQADRDAALNYYESFLIVLAFHESEADRYNQEVVAFQNGMQDFSALGRLLTASERQTAANEETQRRLGEMASQLPQLAADHHSSWQGVLDWTTKWSRANSEAIKMMMAGKDA